jgi:hypothetical protein
MIRALTLAAALAAGLAFPVLAADTATTNEAGAAPAATAKHFGNFFTEDQARQHLMHLGYANVSSLEKDVNGRWVGTATKDGKTVGVAVQVKGDPIQN